MRHVNNDHIELYTIITECAERLHIVSNRRTMSGMEDQLEG